MCDGQGGDVKDVRKFQVTPEMVESGMARLFDLTQAGVGSAYLVEEVFVAMCLECTRSSER